MGSAIWMAEKSSCSSSPSCEAANIRYWKTNNRPTWNTTPAVRMRFSCLRDAARSIARPQAQPTAMGRTMSQTKKGSPHA